MSFATGARPTPRHVLAAATPHYKRAVESIPSQYLVVPKNLSMWLNDVDGDCVTAEEAFAKACCGILVSDSTVEEWATANGVLNGAYLYTVLEVMQTAGFSQAGDTLDDGPATSVNWADSAALQSAISQGTATGGQPTPVKIGVASSQLQNVSGIGAANGWFALNFTKDANEDHCVSLCGYGSISWLAQCLGVQVPTGVDGTKLGYALFTWSTIGIIDEASLNAIIGEAWLRNPTTKVVGTVTPLPDSVTIYPTPSPVPPPTPVPTVPPTFAEVVLAIRGQKPLMDQDTIIAALQPLWPSS